MKKFISIIFLFFIYSYNAQTAFDMNTIKKQNDTITIPQNNLITFTVITGSSASVLQTNFDNWKNSNPNKRIYFNQILSPSLVTREMYILFK